MADTAERTIRNQTSRAMNIRRVVPDITSNRLNECREFYTGFLGFDVAMDMGWVMTFVSPANPTAQVTLFRADPSAGVQPQLSIEVDDADCQISRSVSTMAVLVYSPDSSGKR